MIELNERGALASRTLEDGRVVDLKLLTLDRVRLTVSENEEAEGYVEGW